MHLFIGEFGEENEFIILNSSHIFLNLILSNYFPLSIMIACGILNLLITLFLMKFEVLLLVIDAKSSASTYFVKSSIVTITILTLPFSNRKWSNDVNSPLSKRPCIYYRD